MNYQRIYDSIIYNAKHLELDRKQQKKLKLNYFERHHIIPKCMNGDNSKDNLVLLTAKEHYICHRLLCKIYPGNFLLQNALLRMCSSKSNGQFRYSPSSRIYQLIREEWAKHKSIMMKGKGNYFYGTSRTGKDNPFYGKTHSTNTKEHLSKKAVERYSSTNYVNPFKGKSTKMLLIEKYGLELGTEKYLDIRMQISIKLKGRKQKILQCPHCNKLVAKGGLKRWHLNNCKFKK